MSKSTLWAGVFIAGFLVYLGFGFYQQGQGFTAKAALASEDNRKVSQQIKEIKYLTSGNLPPIEETFRNFCESIRASAHVIDGKYALEVANTVDNRHISDALIPSPHWGVPMLEVKLTFSQMQDEDRYKQILREISHLEQSLPMDVRGIQGFDKNLEINIQLYGLARRV